MNQDIINQEEWKNPQNWSFLFYSSRRDSRIFVPKRFGWGLTINFGNPKGVAIFAGLLGLSALVASISIIIASTTHR